MSEGFIAYLVECLGRFNLRTDDFIIELTETAATQDTKVFSKNLLELKDLGFVISIDDFGTGYSSLTYISKHPFDELKIDREFVQNIANSKVDLNITKSTLALAKSLNYKVVAEGIEDKDTLSLLKNMGCDFAQGYYYSKPLPLEQYIDWLEEQELKEELDDTE
jgi:EAL domain-containing protein (putative c-di-GMP-specific phosphodiesterase class I)